MRLDREAEQRFFEETVNHVQFGLVAFNAKGEVKMINQAFLELFGLLSLVQLDGAGTCLGGSAGILPRALRREKKP